MRSPFIATLVDLFLIVTASAVFSQCADWRPEPIGSGGANGADAGVNAAYVWDPEGAGPLPPRFVVGGSFNSIEGVPERHLTLRDPATGPVAGDRQRRLHRRHGDHGRQRPARPGWYRRQ